MYTWPRIKTLLSLENKALDSRFSPLCGSLPRRRSHPGRGRPLVERATHRVLIPNLSLPLLLFHDYDYFFRPFFARFDARVDDLEEIKFCCVEIKVEILEIAEKNQVNQTGT